MSIQAPPNLNPGALDRLLAAGIDDWGGVSPVTPDHVNPEAPWPQLDVLRRATEAAGKELVARLPIYPRFVQQPERWLAPEMRARGARPLPMARATRARMAGSPARPRCRSRRQPPSLVERLRRSGWPGILHRARDGKQLDEADVVHLFAARGRAAEAVCRHADELRSRGERRSRRLRRQSQHQLHQRLLLPLPVLRVLQGQARRASARRRLRAGSRGDRAPHPRGLAAGRDRDVPAGRHPSRLHRADLSRHLPDREARGAGDPRARLLAARGVAGRAHARRSRWASSSPSCSAPGSARCPARPPRSWTTRCAG